MLKAVVVGMLQGLERLVGQLAAVVELQLEPCWLLCQMQQALVGPTCACQPLLPTMASAITCWIDTRQHMALPFHTKHVSERLCAGYPFVCEEAAHNAALKQAGTYATTTRYQTITVKEVYQSYQSCTVLFAEMTVATAMPA